MPHELRPNFERAKQEILDRLQMTNEKWHEILQRAPAGSAEEIELIHLKLEIQISEARALAELERLEAEINGVEENGLPPKD